MTISKGLQLYVGAVAALGIALTSVEIALYRPAISVVSVYYMVALGGMIALSRRFPLQVAPKTKVLVDTAAIMAAVLLLPPPLGVLTCTAGKLIGQVTTRGRAIQKVFNTASTAVQIAVASVVCVQLVRGDIVTNLTENIPAILAIALVLYLLNLTLIEGVVSVQLRRRPFHRWWAIHRQEIQHEGSLYLLGVFGAVIGGLHPWSLILLIAPTAVVYRSLRDGMQLQVQTRETVETLADIVDTRDHYTFEHSRRVAEMARELALAMKLPSEDAETIYLAGRVHDVGKIGIQNQILMKEGPLSEVEWREMRTHPEIGARLVERLPEFRRGRDLILSHHERFDGRGYPRGLEANEIPLGARIITVVDAYDSMTSNRAYRSALEFDRVYAELRRNRGTQFDPEVVDTFLEMVRKKMERGESASQPAPRLNPAPA